MNILKLFQSMDNINNGMLDLDSVDWITEFGFGNRFMDKDLFDHCVRVLDKDKQIGFVANVYRHGISDSVGLALNPYQKSNIVWLKEYLETLKAEYSQPAPQQTAATFYVDDRLQTEKARAVLSVLENVVVEVKGKGKCQVLNTTTEPWGFASKAALRYAAKCAGNILHITDKWHIFEMACGVKNLQSADENEPKAIQDALKNAGYMDFDK